MAYISWLASYPKSGNTWLRVVIQNYMADRDEPVSVNKMDLVHGDSAYSWYEPHTQRPANELTLREIAATRGKVQKGIAASDAAVIVVKTHFPLAKVSGHDLFDFSLAAGVIYIVRNPLDVCVSWAKFLGQNFDRTCEMMGNVGQLGLYPHDNNVTEFYSSWSGHVKSWTDARSDQIVVLRYEDLIATPQDHFGRAVVLLMGEPPEQQRLRRAIRFSDFEILQKQEDTDGFAENSRRGQKFFAAAESAMAREN